MSSGPLSPSDSLHLTDKELSNELESTLADSPQAQEQVVLPTFVNVVDDESLNMEFRGLAVHLNDLNQNWQIRTACLKRISTLSEDEKIISLSNFTQVLYSFRQIVQTQITDRRSQVVKVATSTMQTVSRNLANFIKSKIKDKNDSIVVSDDSVYVDLVSSWLSGLSSLWPNTVHVISSSAIACGHSLIVDLSELDLDTVPAFLTLIENSKHRHASTREQSYRGLSILLEKIKPQVANIIKNNQPYPNDQNNTNENGSSKPGNDNSKNLGLSPMDSLYNSLSQGVHDSDAVVRQVARKCLIAITNTQVNLFADSELFNAVQNIIKQMPSPTRKLFDEETNKKKRDPQNANRLSATALFGGSGQGSAPTSPNNQPLESNLDPSSNDISPNPKSPQKILSPKSPGSGSASASGSGSVGLREKLKARRAKLSHGSGSLDIDNKAESDNIDVVILTNSKPSPNNSETDNNPSDQETTASLTINTNHKAPLNDEEIKKKIDESEHTNNTQAKNENSTNNDLVKNSQDNGAGPASTAASRNHLLLSKLLDLESPTLTDKMVSFLLQDGVIEVLISFISRLEPQYISWEKINALNNPPTPSKKALKANKKKKDKNDDFQSQIHLSQSERENLLSLNDSSLKSKSNYLKPRPRPNANDLEEEAAVKRSYNVFQMLTNNFSNSQNTSSISNKDNTLLQSLKNKLSTLILHLLSVFHPASLGNIYHTCAILTAIGESFPAVVASVITSPAGRCLFPLMFDFIHEAPVSNVLLLFLSLPLSESDSHTKTFFIDFLKKAHLIDIVISAITKEVKSTSSESTDDHSLFVNANADFILQLFDKIANDARLCPLAEEFEALDGPITCLLVCMESSSIPQWQRHASCKVLLSILTHCGHETREVPDTAGLSQAAINQLAGMGPLPTRTVPNPVHFLVRSVIKQVKFHISNIASSITHYGSDSSEHNSINFSSYRVNSSFGSFRLVMMELLVHAVETDPECVSTIPLSSFVVLTNWFFTYCHNNIYGRLYTELLLALLKGGPSTVPLVKSLIIEHRLIIRLIDFYRNDIKSTGPTSSHSFALKILNFVRLSADLHGHHHASFVQTNSPFLFSTIQSLQQWKDFLGTLRQQSLLQATNSNPVPLHPNLSEEQKIVLSKYGPEGIDLGSLFAFHLGFTIEPSLINQNPLDDKTPKKKKKKKNKKKRGTKLLIDDASDSSESLTAGHSASASEENENEEDDDTA